MATKNKKLAKSQVVIPEEIAIDGKDFFVKYGEVDEVLDNARGRIEEITGTPRVSTLRFDEHDISTRDFCLSAALARMSNPPKRERVEERVVSNLSMRAKIQGLREQMIAAFKAGDLELNNSVTMGPPLYIDGRNFWELVIPSVSLTEWVRNNDGSLKIEIGARQVFDAGLQSAENPQSRNGPVLRQVYQENEIFRKIGELGLNPLALPKYLPGKSGAKAQVREALGSQGMWAGTNVFNKAWERLSSNTPKKIAYTG